MEVQGETNFEASIGYLFFQKAKTKKLFLSFKVAKEGSSHPITYHH